MITTPKHDPELRKKLKMPSYQRYQDGVDLIKKLKLKGSTLKIKKDFTVSFQHENQNPENEKKIQEALKKMMPWRKGPFEILGERVDAEWQSNLKWERIKKVCGPLQGKKILDIGCNNGYYMFLMSAQKPKFVLGVDPTVPYYQQFQLLSQFNKPENIHFALKKVEDLKGYEKTFDVIFCLGILYHSPDPVGLLKHIWSMLRPGGQLIMETMGVNKAGTYFLFPEKRYGGMPGFWFIPTKEAHENILKRSGFQYVKTFFETPTTSEEQRKTIYAPYESLEDGLDSKNKDLTSENYPAPWRFYTRAIRARKRR